MLLYGPETNTGVFAVLHVPDAGFTERPFYP